MGRKKAIPRYLMNIIYVDPSTKTEDAYPLSKTGKHIREMSRANRTPNQRFKHKYSEELNKAKQIHIEKCVFSKLNSTDFSNETSTTVESHKKKNVHPVPYIPSADGKWYGMSGNCLKNCPLPGNNRYITEDNSLQENEEEYFDLSTVNPNSADYEAESEIFFLNQEDKSFLCKDEYSFSLDEDNIAPSEDNIVFLL